MIYKMWKLQPGAGYNFQIFNSSFQSSLMTYKGVVPVLYSSDIKRSIRYYTQVLGFGGEWEWDDPPTFGGVSRDLVQLFFCKEAQGHPGTWIAINVDDVDELFENIRAKGGSIISPPEDKAWGLREMLVQDPDGHIIRFGQHKQHGRKSSSQPATFHIVERLPTADEYNALVKAVGWKVQEAEHTAEVLKAPVWAAVAEDPENHKTVGCVLLLSDNASFYYVKDLMVDPDYQSKNIGTSLMNYLNVWLEKNAVKGALVGLYTGENLRPFYSKFGFRESFGMSKRI
jgi:catechol 2,3-dioxygenase-like lactoylglutathione lyase family enzyme